MRGSIHIPQAISWMCSKTNCLVFRLDLRFLTEYLIQKRISSRIYFSLRGISERQPIYSLQSKDYSTQRTQVLAPSCPALNAGKLAH